MEFLDHSFHFAGDGRTATTDRDDHVRDLILQVLFTNPGERVNLPEFGCGLRELVFMPNSDVLATATQFLVQGALDRWLDGVITVNDVRVQADDERLVVDVAYTRLDTGERSHDHFALGA
jgi:phage baseplate assembly protein W